MSSVALEGAAHTGSTWATDGSQAGSRCTSWDTQLSDRSS